MVDAHFPAAPLSRVVLDNRTTHTLARLSEAFPPAAARCITRKLELHPTPKHGSWLNLVAIDPGVLADQCLDQRIPDLSMLHHEIAVWEEPRPIAGASIDWRFTIDQARVRLHRLYPSESPGETLLEKIDLDRTSSSPASEEVRFDQQRSRPAMPLRRRGR